MTVYLDTQYLFRLIWTTSINDHQCAVPCAACHFMLLHSRPASNPRLVDFQAYLYLAAKMRLHGNKQAQNSYHVMMPDANGLQLGNFWSPVAVASRHFHVCGSWLWDVLRCHDVLWLTRAIIADANWCQACSAVIRPAEANCQDQRSGSRVMQRPRRLKWWYNDIYTNLRMKPLIKISQDVSVSGCRLFDSKGCKI